MAWDVAAVPPVGPCDVTADELEAMVLVVGTVLLTVVTADVGLVVEEPLIPLTVVPGIVGDVVLAVFDIGDDPDPATLVAIPVIGLVVAGLVVLSGPLAEPPVVPARVFVGTGVVTPSIAVVVFTGVAVVVFD